MKLVLRMVVNANLLLEQLEVKAIFLHGDLEEEILTHQQKDS